MVRGLERSPDPRPNSSSSCGFRPQKVLSFCRAVSDGSYPRYSQHNPFLITPNFPKAPAWSAHSFFILSSQLCDRSRPSSPPPFSLLPGDHLDLRCGQTLPRDSPETEAALGSSITVCRPPPTSHCSSLIHAQPLIHAAPARFPLRLHECLIPK